MKKGILTFLGLLLVISSFAQSWQKTGNDLQFRIVGPDTNFRFSRGTGYTYLYTAPQINTIKRLQNIRIDSVKNNILPIGQKGQQLKVATENTNKYKPDEPLIYGQFIYNDAQLGRALSNGFATQVKIFNSFKRFSVGGDPNQDQGLLINGKIPVRADQTNSWSYDTLTNKINSTYNTGSFIGFTSTEKFTNYVHTATLSSTGVDNDRVGLVIAYFEDLNDMVVNQAFGLNPADFNWPIDVASPTIPNQHTLTLFRERENQNNTYAIWYDFNKPEAYIVANNTSPFKTIANWGGNTVDVRVTRLGDTILVNTSDFSDAPGGKGSLRFPISINLSSDPRLVKFRGPCAYGYCAQSQALANYSNISFSGSLNVIYDLRTGDTYNFTNSGYVLDPAKNVYTDFGGRYFWRNITENTFGYILPTGTYDVIVGETP